MRGLALYATLTTRSKGIFHRANGKALATNYCNVLTENDLRYWFGSRSSVITARVPSKKRGPLATFGNSCLVSCDRDRNLRIECRCDGIERRRSANLHPVPPGSRRTTRRPWVGPRRIDSTPSNSVTEEHWGAVAHVPKPDRRRLEQIRPQNPRTNGFGTVAGIVREL